MVMQLVMPHITCFHEGTFRAVQLMLKMSHTATYLRLAGLSTIWEEYSILGVPTDALIIASLRACGGRGASICWHPLCHHCAM